jgi:23S rRNA (adenine2503-C2)-methyltransferase
MTTKADIRLLGLNQFKQIVKDADEPEFRAKQLYEWIWKKSARDFNSMTNLPAAFREKLEEKYLFNAANIVSKQESKDGTIKYLFELHDHKKVEGVLIPSYDRITICISTQVGCGLGCTFCATAKIGIKRNLSFDEIYDQVAIMNAESLNLFKKKITNIVYMGMGEPLLNYDNVKKSVTKITSPDGLGFSPQRITVSTAGIPDGIKRLANDKVKFNLALSLNAASNEKRSKLMPINKKYNLEVLKPVLKYYYEATKNLITFEYIILSGYNNTDEDIKNLKNFARGLPCKINLIEYNRIQDSSYNNTSVSEIENFKLALEKNHFIVNIRKSRGRDIDAACGQLAGKAYSTNE